MKNWRPSKVLRCIRRTTQTTQHHRHRLELPCLLGLNRNPFPLLAQSGLFRDGPLPYSNFTSPPHDAQLWSPPSRPSPGPDPSTSLSEGHGSKPILDGKRIGYLGCSCSRQVPLPPLQKKENPQTVLTVSIALANAMPSTTSPSSEALGFSAHLLGPERDAAVLGALDNPRYQETKLPLRC